MRRTLQLHVTAGTEIDVLPFRQFECQLLDESGNVGVALYRALPLLHAEDFLRHFDFHVLLDGGLTAQAPAFLCIALGEMPLFRGQHGTAALGNDAFALCAGAAAAAGGGQEQAALGEGLQQLATRGDVNGFLAVDFNGDFATANQA